MVPDDTDRVRAPSRPNRVVTFLRPKEGQSPTTATFQVPLTFNKFDFRDYLYNLYDVEVDSVRSFINQKLPKQRSLAGRAGRWYRPRPQKLMIVDLKKPFVWPERPTGEELEEWDCKLHKAVKEGHQQEVDFAEAQGKFAPPRLRADKKMTQAQRILRSRAKDLLQGKVTWSPEWVKRMGRKNIEALQAATEAPKVAGRKQKAAPAAKVKAAEFKTIETTATETKDEKRT